MHFLGAADWLTQFQLHEPSNEGIPEKEADQKRGETGTQCAKRDVLEDIQPLGSGNAVKGGRELGEVVEHAEVRKGVEESPRDGRCGLP